MSYIITTDKAVTELLDGDIEVEGKRYAPVTDLVDYSYLEPIFEERDRIAATYGYNVEHDAEHSEADFLLYIQKQMNRAVNAIGTPDGVDTDGNDASDYLVKIGGLVHSYLESRTAASELVLMKQFDIDAQLADAESRVIEAGMCDRYRV